MMKKIIRIVSFVLVALLACVIVFNVACYVKGAVTGEQCPLIFGFGSAVVISGSMEDTIPLFSLVFVHQQEEYHPEDIIVYQGNTYCVTHRLISMETDENGQVWVTAKGDYNSMADEPFPYEHIIGKVLFWIPGVGYLQQFLQKPIGFLTLTLIAAALLILPERFKKRKK
ncbi:MAG: signal peptidase I [Clostridia bacterium]|nr:signal peptidase I [Clostridia bacterium]